MNEEDRIHDPVALQDLIATLWLYTSRYAETQLTTPQRELYYNVVEYRYPDGDRLERWWR